tara:strand:- start:1881 stop:2288 length:408 start_codon:yes stop_codon:yes gene_type:complete
VCVFHHGKYRKELVMKKNPFDHLNSILATKKPIDIEGYNPWLVNNGLSQHPEWIHLVNFVNQHHFLSKDAQYSFFINSRVRKIKERRKWAKSDKQNDIEMIAEYYNYSYDKAKITMELLSPEQLKVIRNSKGGKR